jgi:hypothetical protein
MKTSNAEHRTLNIERFLPLYPDDLLTPALSSFWGGEGDGSRGPALVPGFTAIKTSNIEYGTLNIEGQTLRVSFRVRRSMFDVRCFPHF